MPTGRSDQGVDAAVGVLSDLNIAVSEPRLSPSTVSPAPPPRLSRSIGCGLDRLNWDRVSRILEEVFSGSDISITVYSLPERAETKVMNENRHR